MENMVDSSSTQILTDLLLLLATVVSGLLANYVRAKTKANMVAGGTQRLGHLIDLARTAVVAAEKFIGSGNGAEKLLYATGAVQTAAKAVGIKVTEAEASAVIHAALAELDGIFSENVPEAA